MVMDVVFVHGINTPPDYSLVDNWGPFFPRARVRESRWDSTGSIVGDVKLIATSRDFADDSLGKVCDSVRGANMIVAHSMGTVWVLELMRRNPKLFDNVIVWLFGSPCSNALIRPMLEFRGLLQDPGRVVPHYWNRDDIVCAVSQWASHPAYTEPRYVSIAGRSFEHPMEKYLAAHEVKRDLVAVGAA